VWAGKLTAGDIIQQRGINTKGDFINVGFAALHPPLRNGTLQN
jgi:hypothetical protein